MLVSGIRKNVSKELGGKCEEVNAAQRKLQLRNLVSKFKLRGMNL